MTIDVAQVPYSEVDLEAMQQQIIKLSGPLFWNKWTRDLSGCQRDHVLAISDIHSILMGALRPGRV